MRFFRARGLLLAHFFFFAALSAEGTLPALVVGVSTPGPEGVVTVALDSSELHLSHQFFSPDIQADIMSDHPSFVRHGYGMIVFQGCCPVAFEAGGNACGSILEGDYDAIDVRLLAHRVLDLISLEGGQVYIRNCLESYYDDLDTIKRDHFISEFKRAGLIQESPRCPPAFIPSSYSSEVWLWQTRGGALVFRVPPRRLNGEFYF